MACSTLVSGITFNPCEKSLGGISKVYLANYDDVDPDNFTLDADERITNITFKNVEGSNPPAPAHKFFAFSLRKNTGSMTSTLNVDDNNGSSISTDGVMNWRMMEYEKRKAMSAFLQGEFVAIVKDANGKYWFLGKNLAVSASGGTGETGTSYTDANRYEITLNDVSNDWPHEVKFAPDPDVPGDTDYVDSADIMEPGEKF